MMPPEFTFRLKCSIHDFDVGYLTHPHLERRSRARLDSSGDSHHLAGEMLDRLDAGPHDLVCGFCHPGGKLPAVTEVNVVVGATKPGPRIMHRLDLRNLELHGDILFWHLLD